METRTNLYPIYVSGQYLTSEHLNETHNFLWEEEKATRYMLIGNGIANGMSLSSVASGNLLQTIGVTIGVAATIDGYIVSVDENITLDKAIEKDLVWYTLADGSNHMLDKTKFDLQQAQLEPTAIVTLSGYEMFLSDADVTKLPDGVKKMGDAVVAYSSILSGYMVIAFVEITDLANNHCQQGDCNTKGIQRNFSIRYFLSKTDGISVQNTVSAQLPLCSVARIKNLAGITSKAGFHQKSYDAWKASYNELIPYFTTGSAASLKIVSDLVLLDGSSLSTASDTFRQIGLSINNTNCPQYYSAFASDLSVAINELVDVYNVHIGKYFSMNANRIGRAIFIGNLNAADVDPYRYYFSSDVYLNQKSLSAKKLMLLLNRVLALINNFILMGNYNAKTNAVATRPKQTPTIRGTDVLLQNCALSSYLDISGANNTLLKYWNPNGGNLGNVFSFYDAPVRSSMSTKSVITSWSRYNFFLLEGHVGMAKETALANIKSFIAEQGLPIQVLDCTYAAPAQGTTTAQMSAEIVAQLKAWGVLMTKRKAEFPLMTKKFTDLITALSNTSTRGFITEKEALGRSLIKPLASKSADEIFNDVFAYLGTIFISKRTLPTEITKNDPLADERTKFLALNTKPAYDKLLADYKEYKSGVVLNPPTTQLTLKDLPDLEYLTGVARGGTFVLIHDGTTVLGDGCLPYYYSINKARVV
jgi:hypothetical protein